MKNKYSICRASFNDIQPIQEVLLAAFEEYREFYTPEAFTDTILSNDETAKERLKQMKVYVAIDYDGNIIGTIGWQKLDIEEGHIRGMAVHPKKQGRNSPATSLLQYVEDEARSEGCKIMTLDTTDILQRAQKFYSKNGYKKTGKTTKWLGHIIIEFAKQLI
ncbi:MAG: GNAT family N-acetyltransferase [Candidatus Hodarchaeota archaeon]